MKFSENKFKNLNQDRQLKKIYDFMNQIVLEQKESNEYFEQLEHLLEMILWLDFDNEISVHLSKVSMESKIIDLNKILIEMDKYLGKKLKDHDFLTITKDDKQISKQEFPLVFILDNLRSAFNVGSIFRTAECLGVKEIALCGVTITPNQKNKIKSAMGTDDYVKWKYFEETSLAIDYYNKLSYKIYALETTIEGKSIYEIDLPKPLALLFGNEALGIQKETLELVDEVVQIPVNGKKNSLNVGVCAAVCGYEVVRKWGKM